MFEKSRPSILPVAVGALLIGAAAPAFAQTVSEVAVSPRAPTQITISLVGKAPTTVRSEVHVASRAVCRNAVRNQELEFHDVRWCSQKTEVKAMRRYAAIQASAQQTAFSGTIVLSSR
jgi:hypothetical protein